LDFSLKRHLNIPCVSTIKTGKLISMSWGKEILKNKLKMNPNSKQKKVDLFCSSFRKNKLFILECNYIKELLFNVIIAQRYSIYFSILVKIKQCKNPSNNLSFKKA